MFATNLKISHHRKAIELFFKPIDFPDFIKQLTTDYQIIKY